MSGSKASATRNSKVRARRPLRVKSVAESVAEPALRETGIRVMGEVPWGAHICIFYETDADLLDTAAAYFAAGLANNEFCVWAISDPITPANARDSLSQAIPDLDRQLAGGRLAILPGSEWYLLVDQFGLKRITD